MLFELICLGAEDVNWEAQSEGAEDEAACASTETENEHDSSGELGSIFNLSVIKSFNVITSPLELAIKVTEILAGVRVYKKPRFRLGLNLGKKSS